MLNLFERDIVAIGQRLILLPPVEATIPQPLNVTVHAGQHRRWINEVQRLRGSIYLRDGALKPSQLTTDGRHVTPEDWRAWHLLALNEHGELAGCIWYLEHRQPPTIENLRVRSCPLAMGEWRDKLRQAVDAEVSRARRDRIGYAEVGGWAVECGRQCVSSALLLILGTYGLSQIAGGAMVIATATVRHSSAKILRRLGGSHLEGHDFTVPAYYDPRYDCDMELLKFDTRRPSAKYAEVVKHLVAGLSRVPVIASAGAPVARPMPLFSPALAAA